MENIFSPIEGLSVLGIYALIMITLALWSKQRHQENRVEFLLAGRKVGVLFGAMSAAVSWIWAPALFLGSQKAYEQGIAGIFAFLVPNFFALIVFSFIALKARKIFPNGFTLPELMKEKYGSKVHKLYLFKFISLQTCSFSIQILAGSTLISLMTGISLPIIGLCLTLIALSYSIIGGFRASIITDVIQMTIILGVIAYVIPNAIDRTGGFVSVVDGLAGINDVGGHILNPWILYSFGIPVAITLITGPVSDQMHWQRAYSLGNDQNVLKTFFIAACLFISVPLSLSVLGFIAANPDISQGWHISNPQMVGPITVSYLFSDTVLIAFSLMLISGLCSTLDSILCAVSSLTAIDIFTHDSHEQGTGRKVYLARLGMVGVATVGLAMAILPGIQIIHLWFFATTFRAPSFIPTILTLFWKPITAKSVFYAISLSIIIGGPTYIVGVIIKNPHLIVLGSMIPLIISAIVCLCFGRVKNSPKVITT